MYDRFKVEELHDHHRCGDHYCSGHSAWHIRDTKTGRTVLRYREPTNDVVELLNFVAECIEDTNGT